MSEMVCWLIIRLLGTLFAIITLSETGPILLTSNKTGGLVLLELLPLLITIFFFAGFLLPLLLNFGLLEFC